MTTFAERRRARQKGSLAAMRATARLERDPSEPVDVFGVIEDRRVWLMFQPLDHLYGFYDRRGEASGIVIHSGHPLSLQRFTAAHELGHYFLNHERSVDSEREVNSSAADLPLQEIEAQAFAADFLMPPELMNRALARLSLSSAGRIEPMDAYQLSLEIGSSYRATITQLEGMRVITPELADSLRRHKPIEIKANLADGQKPENSRSDVWLVTDGLGARQLFLRLGDEVHVRLPEIPSGGYRWDWDVDGDSDALELIADQMEPFGESGTGRVGARRERHLWFRAVAPIRGRLRARLVRSWQGPSATSIDEVSVKLRVVLPRTGGVVKGASRRQRRVVAA